MKRNEYILYGIDKYKEVIDEIISELDTSHDIFDVRLMLTEALTNAFKHGNNNSVDKPIYLRTICDRRSVEFEIEDSGTGFLNGNIPDEISDENILDNCGRGLFILKSIADKIDFRKNTLVIQKNIS
ncbi:MAG: ATP-binding protein [Maledivibacter sp.]|jgi:serine/threonine-protein kinase RsbW|nr:ATP-binding protein [Maledivibacter sp.]